MKPAKLAFLAAFGFTAAVIVFVVLFGQAMPQTAAGMAEGYETPILALEFANSRDDLAFVRAEDADELRAAHTPEQIDRAIAAFTKVGKKLGVVS